MTGRPDAEAIDWPRILGGLSPGPDVRGVGVDVETVRSLRARPKDPRALFTPAERAYCESQADPWESYTGTWCAKEAVVKALSGVQVVSVRDIEIRREPSGRPVAFWTAGGPQDQARRVRLEVSIAHAGGAAVAVATAVSTEG